MKSRFHKKTNFIEQDVEYFVSLGIIREFAEVLSSKGVTRENCQQYFDKTNHVFHNPFEMKNMTEAVALVKKHIDQKSKILVFGDYDADGLTASAILSLYFDSVGICADVCVPTRQKGYGLHFDLVKECFNNNHYDLIITVDCGISNKNEVDLIIQNLNVDVLVTDHHEVPEEIPVCVCLNPKLGDYPFAYLSGAGVAFKLVEAIAGYSVAKSYVDLAMVGTVADMMPLTDENRSIVIEGLENFNNAGLKKLAEVSKCSFPLTATDVAIKIAPKINAAGRVQSPEIALQALLSDKKASLKTVTKLCEMNELRKGLMDKAYAIFDDVIDVNESINSKIVFVQSDKVEQGILGIVANYYKSNLNLPTAIMTSEGNNFVGSARGIDGVNMHELFSNASDLLVKFGGHHSSVGFAVEKKNFDKLRDRLSELLKKYPDEVFEKKSYYDLDFDPKIPFSKYCELIQMLEPVLPSDSLIFKIKDSAVFASTFGKNDAYLSITMSNGLELKGFSNFENYLEPLKSGAETECVFTLGYDKYSEKYCGTLNDLYLNNSLHFEQHYLNCFLKNISKKQKAEKISLAHAKNILTENSILAVFDSFDDFSNIAEKVDFNDFTLDYFYQRYPANRSVVISPIAEFNYERYEHVLIFSAHSKCSRKYSEKALFVDVSVDDSMFSEIKISRELCVLAYKTLKSKSDFETLETAYNKFLLTKMSYPTFLLTVKIFEELNLIKVVDECVIQFTKEKADLIKSELFVNFS